MKKSLQKILIATSLTAAAVTSFVVISPTVVEAAGTTYSTLKKGHSTGLMYADTFVVTSGSAVTVSDLGWVTAVSTGSATVKGYSGGVLVWTWHFTVTN